jgi:hypothetical protein
VVLIMIGVAAALRHTWKSDQVSGCCTSARCSSGSGEPMERIAAAGSAAVHRPHLYVSCDGTVAGQHLPDTRWPHNGHVPCREYLHTARYALHVGLGHLIVSAFCHLQPRNLVPVSAEHSDLLRRLCSEQIGQCAAEQILSCVIR